MERSAELPGHGGRLVFVGLTQARLSFDNPSFHRRELTVLASRNSNNAFPRLIRLLEDGLINIRPLDHAPSTPGGGTGVLRRAHRSGQRRRESVGFPVNFWYHLSFHFSQWIEE